MSNGEGKGSPVSLSEALQDYSAEGAEILYSEPSPLLRAMIYLIAALLLTGLAWSFIGHADVIVSAPGVLAPEEALAEIQSGIAKALLMASATELACTILPIPKAAIIPNRAKAMPSGFQPSPNPFLM